MPARARWSALLTEFTESPSRSATSLAGQPTHVAQDQRGARARGEVLDRDDVGQLDGLARHRRDLRLVGIVGGQLVEQPVGVGLQPQHLAAGGGLGRRLASRSRQALVAIR